MSEFWTHLWLAAAPGRQFNVASGRISEALRGQ
jgi:hypothetical protein